MNTIELKSKKLVGALLAAGVLGGAGVTGLAYLTQQAHAVTAPAAAAQAGANAAPIGPVTAPNFAAIAARHGPAVVNISTSGTQRAADSEDEEDAQSTPRPRGRAPGKGSPEDFFGQFGLPPGLFQQAPGGRGSAGGIGAFIGYSPYCVPQVIDEVRCVLVNEALRDIEPMAWDFVMNFARDNELTVVEIDARA